MDKSDDSAGALQRQLDRLGELNHPESLVEGLKLLYRLFENIGKNPLEMKFRSIKTTNARLSATLFKLEEISAALQLSGFTYSPLEESWVLNDSNLGVLLPAIGELKLYIDLLEANMQSPEAYAKALEVQKAARELKRQQAAKDKQNAAVKEQCENDKLERKYLGKAKDSIAQQRNFGSNQVTYKDLGVDLNKKSG